MVPIRPIAIGSTYRRLVAKIACARVSNKLGAEYRPSQLGFGTKGGAEAGAHAARNFINTKHSSTKVFLKLDYRNAFNELERDVMLLSTWSVQKSIVLLNSAIPNQLNYHLATTHYCRKEDASKAIHVAHHYFVYQSTKW